MATDILRPRAQESGHLTPRQREILVLLARGLYYREIGAALGISSSTVRAHLHSCYQRLQVKSRARAVAKFYELDGLARSKAKAS